MKSLHVERALKKTKCVFITENDPAFVFLFDTMDEANNALSELTELFGTKDITLHIRYSQRFLNFTIIDEETSEMVNVNNIPFDNSYHFRLVKTLANRVMGKGPTGKKLTKNLELLFGRRTIGGFQTAFLQDVEGFFGKISKLSTNLIPEP